MIEAELSSVQPYAEKVETKVLKDPTQWRYRLIVFLAIAVYVMELIMLVLLLFFSVCQKIWTILVSGREWFVTIPYTIWHI